MSKVAISGGATGSATYTIQAPTGSTDRVLTLPDEAGTVLTNVSALGVSQLPSQLSVNGSAASGSLAIDSAGRATMPYQPAFHVRRTAGDVTSGNYYLFNSVIHNIGNHYSTSTGRFTAPVNGVYHISFSTLADRNTLQNEWYLHKNGGRLIDTRDDTQNSRYQTLGASASIYLNAGDWIALFVDSGTMYGGSGSWSNFSGYLVG